MFIAFLIGAHSLTARAVAQDTMPLDNRLIRDHGLHAHDSLRVKIRAMQTVQGLL
jgi:hypothetical protein